LPAIWDAAATPCRNGVCDDTDRTFRRPGAELGRRIGIDHAELIPAFEGRGRGPERHYPTVTLAEIMALPVVTLAASDCALFLWLPRMLIFNARDVVEAWGFTGKSIAFVWVKPRRDRQADLLNPERDFPPGLGYGTHANAEICLLATRGALKRLNADVSDVIEAPRHGHSRKPIEAYHRIE
jgi:N6-adenosine-specific RNA methylase IME4